MQTVRKLPDVEIVYGLHGGSDAIHMHPGRVGRHCGDQSGVPVIGLKLRLSPTRQDPGAQSESIAELRRRS